MSCVIIHTPSTIYMLPYFVIGQTNLCKRKRAYRLGLDFFRSGKFWKHALSNAPKSFVALQVFMSTGVSLSSFSYLKKNALSTSFQNCANLNTLDGNHLLSAILTSCNRFSFGYISKLWLCHSNTWICYNQKYSIVALAVCSGGCPAGRWTSIPVSTLLLSLTGFLAVLSHI